MANQTIYNLAFDLGASSGRLMLSKLANGETVELTELHRFPNEPVMVNGTFMWDTVRLVHEMTTGLKAAAALNLPIDGIGIDTWGVDYGFLDKDGNLIGVPINYRDARTDNSMSEVAAIMPLSEIYESTGIQFMALNTIFQLHADKQMRPVIYENADKLLFMPDLLAYFLTGETVCEYTIASTSQLLGANTRTWDKAMMERLGLRTDMLLDIIQPGTVIGTLTKAMQDETGLGAVPVIAVGSHDTASAVAATPFNGKENAEDNKGKDGNAIEAFLSCGTWSLLGVELDEPIITAAAFESNFTNEGGVEGTIRFLKNINGLWVIQQLRKSWNELNNVKIGYPEIAAAAKAANQNFAIDPSDPVFLAPQNMVATITRACEQAGQGTPQGIGELAIAVYNGLTGEYKTHVDNLARLAGRPIGTIHMIGGGIQDEFLCQMTAKATGRTIQAGPVEGSVLGNILMQWKARGRIASLAEGRSVIRRSFEQKIYG